ncbi:MAG TPA: hypothetical protein VGM92_12765 [Candidatus Kapabacteria bacterium]|jgi:hypothetical protein
MQKKLRFFFFGAALLASCSRDASTSPPASEFVQAKAGSTFTFDEYSTDSTNAIIPGARDTMVSTVLRTDSSIDIKSNVLFVEEKRGSARDTAYYAYESNGNLSIYVNPSDPTLPFWETLPTGTGTTIVRATTYSLIGFDTTVVNDSTVSSLIGTESITVKGAPLSVKKMLLSFRHATTNSGVTMESVLDETIYYAPSLGFIAKTSVPSRPDPFGGWIDGGVQTLMDYDLK